MFRISYVKELFKHNNLLLREEGWLVLVPKDRRALEQTVSRLIPPTGMENEAAFLSGAACLWHWPCLTDHMVNEEKCVDESSCLPFAGEMVNYRTALQTQVYKCYTCQEEVPEKTVLTAKNYAQLFYTFLKL